MDDKRTVVFDGIYGLAVADALGVPYESASLKEMQEHPCTGMIGYGHHNQPEGSWSDDTSMSLCTADSLCKGFDPEDMMKKFLLWKDHKQYTATGAVFDVGRSCRKALNRFAEGFPAEYCGDKSIDGNGNGGLMRILPITLYQYFNCKSDDDHLEEFLNPIHVVSSLTHAHEIGLICCGLFALTLREWLNQSESNNRLVDIAQRAFEKGKQTYSRMGGEFRKTVNQPGLFTEPKELRTLIVEELPSWGYVLNTWNIALWSLITTDNYRDCVLKAVNVGGDTDSNAAVAGALAGIIYGQESIPEEWIQKLQNKRLIELICDRFSRCLFGRSKDNVTQISSFAGEYAFLAPKARSKFLINDVLYDNVVAAYLAQAVPKENRWDFASLNAKKARKHYRELSHLEPEEGDKEERLYRVLYAKYNQNTRLREKLLATNDMTIIYDTTGTHDNEFGRCRCKNCQGKAYQNLYGKALMKVRETLKHSCQ